MHNTFLFRFTIAFSMLLLSLLSGYTVAQSTSTSPYSSYGFGQRDGLDHGTYEGIGATTITYFDSTTLNFYNPASYNTMGKGQPMFSVGVSSRLSFYSEDNVKSFNKAVLLNNYALGFAFGKHFGFAFGIKPFTRRGYEFSTRSMLDTDTIWHRYSGSGSTSEVFLGLSTDVLKLKNQRLAVGGNIGYVFGTLINQRKSNIIGSQSGGIDQNILKINALHYEFGMYYKQRFNNKHSYTLSAVIEPQQHFNATQRWDLFTSSHVDNPLYYNRIDSSGTIKGKITTAPSTTFGFSYSFRFNDVKKERQTRNSEISLHTSYNTTDWTRFATNFGGINLPSGFVSTSKLTLGVQYIPETSFMGQSSKWGFLETMRYRAGFYQYTLPYIVNGLTVMDKAMTFGVGIPVRGQKSLSSVNFGVAYGKRGNGTASALNEHYLSVNASIIIAPAIFERWFIKRKLD